MTQHVFDETVLKLSTALRLTLVHEHISLETLRSEDRNSDLVRLRRMFCAYVFHNYKLPYKVAQIVLEKKSHATIKHLVELHDEEIEKYPLYKIQYDLFVVRFKESLNSNTLVTQLQTFNVLMGVYNKQYEHIQQLVLAK